MRISLKNLTILMVSTVATIGIAAAQYGAGGTVSGGGYFITLPSSETSSNQTSQGQVLGATAFNFVENLSFGSRGDAVVELQKILISEGFLNIKAPTGWFGPLTQAALIKWQTKNGIPATGYFGPLSRAFLAK